MVTVEEFGLIHTLFMQILERRFERPIPVPDAVQKLLHAEDSSAEDQPLSEAAVAWLDLLGAAISPRRLRRYGQENAMEEPARQALLRFWASRRGRSADDLDKVDWLATHFFRAREEESKEPVGWVKNQLQELLKGIPFAPLGHDAQSLLGELPPLLDDARYMGSFSQIPESRILERGREFKVLMGDDFCHPSALAAVINYNVVMGNKFDELLGRALIEASKTAPVSDMDRLQEACRGDYRANGDVIRELAELTRKLEPEKAEVQIAGPAGSRCWTSSWNLERLGIAKDRELYKLRSRVKDLAKKLTQETAVRSIRICGSPLPLDKWEAEALCSLGGKREENLQGAFARSTARAIALVVRIYEELYAYETKKGAGDAEWRKHHNALFYLLYEGRAHKTALLQLSLLHRKSELPELAQQLATTANKLDANLGRLEDLFLERGNAMLDTPL
ncbi:MAG: hypothetical protein HW398_1089 [Acidobacteria bacterium]|nr:hypothetical protein [Acidobacteriota bacterium]